MLLRVLVFVGVEYELFRELVPELLFLTPELLFTVPVSLELTRVRVDELVALLLRVDVRELVDNSLPLRAEALMPVFSRELRAEGVP